MPDPDCVFCDSSKIEASIEPMFGADGSLFMVFEPLNPRCRGVRCRKWRSGPGRVCATAGSTTGGSKSLLEQDYSVTITREGVDNVALRKHGEGEVIPETEQQKTAAKDGDGMSKQAAEELRTENEEADSVDRDR